MAFSSHPKGRPKGNYDLNQAVVSSDFSENKKKKKEGVTYASKVGTIYVPIHQVPQRVEWGAQSRGLTCSRSFLLKDFPSKSVSYPYGYRVEGSRT